MNILFIHQNFPAQFKFLAPALIDKGHHVSALCITPDKSFAATGIDVHQYKTDRGTTPNIHPWVMDLETKVIRAEACFKAAMKLKESGYMPDLIIAHIGWGESLFIKEVWPDTKLVIYGEFYYHPSGADVGFDPEFPALESAGCAMRAKNLNNIAHFDIADAGISPTEWQKSTFPEPFRSKITVIHDGIDTGKLVPNPNASLSLTVGNGRPLVLTKKDEILTFVNRNLEPYRGYHALMRSLPAILKDRPNLKVLIVGGDKVSYGAAPDPNTYGKLSWKEIYANEVRPQLTEAQWGQLIFLGNVPYEYFVPLLQISTVHVYLTYPFILSWSLLEAMSVGCAIVGSNTAPVQEVIKHNQNGFLVDFFKPQDLANAAITLLDDPALRKKLGQEARKTAVEKYDLKTVCLPKTLGFVEKEVQKQNSNFKHRHKVELKKKEKQKNSLLNKKNSSGESSPTQEEINNLLEHYQKGQYDYAEDLSRNLTKKYPNHQFGWKVLGAVFKQTGRFEEALIANQKAVNLSPKDAEAHSNLGTTLQKIGRLDDAVASYLTAIAIKSEYAEAHYNLGITYQSCCRLEDAVARYRAAIAIKPEYAEAHYNLGITLKELGKLDDSVESFRKAIKAKPEYAEAHSNLSVILHELGRLEDAEVSCRTAIAIKPDLVEAYNNLGVTLKEIGRLEDAVASYRTAIAIKLEYAEAHNNLGITLKEIGRLNDAEISCRTAIAMKPEFAEAHNSLGITLKELGKLDDAVVSYRKAIAIKPDLAEAHSNLGNTLQELGSLDDAEVSCRRAIAIKPDLAEAHSNLGFTLKQLGRLDDALASCRKAISIKPKYAEAHSNLGVTLQVFGKLDDAVASFRTAIAIKPDLAEAHSNLGVTLKELGRLNDAEKSYRTAIAIKPSYVEAHNNLGVTLQELGRLADAIASYRKAIEIKPEYAAAHSNLLFTLNYVGSQDQAMALEEAKRFGLEVSSRAIPKFTSWNVPANKTKLRIGLVSGDLGNHPVGYFIEGFLQHLDQNQFELIAFPTKAKSDALTARIKPLFQEWVPLNGNNDSKKAARIHQNAIQILIDLSGHTSGNQLPVFSYKPAPVQVSWLGYFATTGLPEMDYLLGDPYVTPKSEASHFSEKVWQLPETYLCFTPPNEQFLVSPLPAIQNGFITFGCFNNLTKMGNAVVRVWATILNAIPNSILFLKTKQLNNAKIVADVCSQFAAHGIAPDRLLLERFSPRAELLAAYSRVDIALDPFPYPGGTTSAEALWMGVPVLTLKGDRFLSHVGETIAHNIRYPEWIAKDLDEYVTKAVKFSNNLECLSAMRNELRTKALQSPLFDSARFANNFGKALQEMWRQYLLGTKEQ